MVDTVLKGYAESGEVYAIKQEAPAGASAGRVFELPASPELEKLYKKQKSKFTKRKNWGAKKPQERKGGENEL